MIACLECHQNDTTASTHYEPNICYVCGKLAWKWKPMGIYENYKWLPELPLESEIMYFYVTGQMSKKEMEEALKDAF